MISKEIVKEKILKSIGYIVLVVLCFFILFSVVYITKENEILKKKLEFAESNPKEATIIAVYDSCVCVYDDYVETFIEIDVFEEVIHTNIEVGDIAIYIVDYDYTDADLIAVIKRCDYER